MTLTNGGDELVVPTLPREPKRAPEGRRRLNGRGDTRVVVPRVPRSPSPRRWSRGPRSPWWKYRPSCQAGLRSRGKARGVFLRGSRRVSNARTQRRRERASRVRTGAGSRPRALEPPRDVSRPLRSGRATRPRRSSRQRFFDSLFLSKSAPRHRTRRRKRSRLPEERDFLRDARDARTRDRSRAEP